MHVYISCCILDLEEDKDCNRLKAKRQTDMCMHVCTL